MNETIAIREASNADEHRQLREVVAREYAKQAYIPSANEQLVHSRHYDGACGIRFVAEEPTGKVVGTIALAFDSADLLPMDSLYSEELLILRKKGFRLAEVGQFAVTQDTSMRERLYIVKKLFAVATAALERRAVDAVVITVNPKHDDAYSVFGFTTFAEIKPYVSVGGALAVPKLKFLQKNGNTA